MCKKFLNAVLFIVFIIFSYSMIKPLFLSYDEGDHFVRAYSLIQGKVILDTPKELSTGMYINADLARFVVSHGGAHPLNTQFIANNLSGNKEKLGTYSWGTQEEVFYQMPGTNLYFPAIYLPQALGVFIGEVFFDSIYYSYYFAVVLAMLCSLFLLYKANKLYPINMFVWSLLITPLFLMQLYSSSIDALTTTLAIFIVCLFLHLYRFVNNSSWQGFLSLCALLFVLITCRQHLAPLSLLPIILSFKMKSWKKGGVALIMILMILSWMIIASKTTQDLRKENLLTISEILRIYIDDPILWLNKFWNTITEPDILMDYWEKFFIAIYKGNYLVLPLTVVVIGLFFLSINLKKNYADKCMCLLFILISLLSFLLIFLALSLGWTPIDSLYILGVQGRYFIVPIILLGFAASAGSTPREMKYYSLSKGILLSLVAIMVGYFLVSNYYQNYSRWFLPVQI